MFTVESLDRCIYKVQLSDVDQQIVETLVRIYDVPQEVVLSMMLNFAQYMAVTRIINPIERAE